MESLTVTDAKLLMSSQDKKRINANFSPDKRFSTTSSQAQVSDETKKNTNGSESDSDEDEESDYTEEERAYSGSPER